MDEISAGVPIWVIRAGRGATFAEDFVSGGFVGIGFREAGWLEPSASNEEIEAAVRQGMPDSKEGAWRSASSQLKRFFREIEVGDPVATYDAGQRVYFLGEITSDVQRNDEHPLFRVRKVRWVSKTARDALSVSSRNSLGAILTMFRLSDEVTEELRGRAVDLDAPTPQAPAQEKVALGEPSDGEDDEEALRDETVDKAEAFVEDRIARLDWDDMQELVAGILRAMGYRTRVAARGADRGVDVFASPDGLGLEEPRIFVEVKHRRAQMGAPDIRTFLGGRQQGDRCLYVSTGGFSREAKYEAERAAVPLRLIDLPELRVLLLEHYEELDTATRALVPLRRIYWPAD